MYCKSAICKSVQFELDSVINWKSVKLMSRGSDGENYTQRTGKENVMN